MLNTGTIIGFGSGLFGNTLHDKTLPPFSWGSPGDYTTYEIDKFIESCTAMMKRRDVSLLKDHQAVYQLLHERLAKQEIPITS